MVGVRKKFWISVMRLPKLLLPKIYCPDEVSKGEVLEREKTNCGNQVAEIVGEWGERKKGIVATKLLKMGGKKKKNCGNQVVEIVREGI